MPDEFILSDGPPWQPRVRHVEADPFAEAAAELGIDADELAGTFDRRTVRALQDHCPKHDNPWLPGVAPGGYRRCTLYIPELGVSEDYGCPQTGGAS